MSFFSELLTSFCCLSKGELKIAICDYCIKLFLYNKTKFKLGNIQLGTRLINHVSDLIMYAIVNYEKNIISNSVGNQRKR